MWKTKRWRENDSNVIAHNINSVFYKWFNMLLFLNFCVCFYLSVFFYHFFHSKSFFYLTASIRACIDNNYKLFIYSELLRWLKNLILFCKQGISGHLLLSHTTVKWYYQLWVIFKCSIDLFSVIMLQKLSWEWIGFHLI